MEGFFLAPAEGKRALRDLNVILTDGRTVGLRKLDMRITTSFKIKMVQRLFSIAHYIVFMIS